MGGIGCIIINPSRKGSSCSQTTAKVKECLRSLKKAPKGSLFKKHIKSNGDSTGIAKNGKASGKNGKKQNKSSVNNKTSDPKSNPLTNTALEKPCLRPAFTTTKSNAGTVVYSHPAAIANSRPAIIANSRPAIIANSRPAIIANSPGHKSPTVRQQLQHQHQILQQQGATFVSSNNAPNPNQSPNRQLQQQKHSNQQPQARKLFSPTPKHLPPPAPREWDVLSIDPDSVDSEFDIYQRAEDIAEIREKHLDLKRVRISTLLEAQHEDGGGFYRGEDFDNWSEED